MNNSPAKVLIIGYGNPGRLDDGLGPALAEKLLDINLPGVEIDSDYQLTVENAIDIARHEIVIFADADVSGPEPFHFTKIEPVQEISFSSHNIRPEALISLAKKLFNSKTRGFILGIRGYEFNEYAEKLSANATANLVAALEFVKSLIAKGNFLEAHANLNRDNLMCQGSLYRDRK